MGPLAPIQDHVLHVPTTRATFRAPLERPLLAGLLRKPAAGAGRTFGGLAHGRVATSAAPCPVPNRLRKTTATEDGELPAVAATGCPAAKEDDVADLETRLKPEGRPWCFHPLEELVPRRPPVALRVVTAIGGAVAPVQVQAVEEGQRPCRVGPEDAAATKETSNAPMAHGVARGPASRLATGAAAVAPGLHPGRPKRVVGDIAAVLLTALRRAVARHAQEAETRPIAPSVQEDVGQVPDVGRGPSRPEAMGRPTSAAVAPATLDDVGVEVPVRTGPTARAVEIEGVMALGEHRRDLGPRLPKDRS